MCTPLSFILLSESSFYKGAIAGSALRIVDGELNLKVARVALVMFGNISCTVQDEEHEVT